MTNWWKRRQKRRAAEIADAVVVRIAARASTMPPQVLTVRIEADTEQFDAAIARARETVQELLDLTEELPSPRPKIGGPSAPAPEQGKRRGKR